MILRILITGGNGFIGRDLAISLKENNEVHLVDLAFSEILSNIFSGYHVCDITKLEDLKQVVNKVNPDVICHLVARVSFAWAIKEPLQDLNIHARATLNVLESARLLGTKPHIIYPSTSAVFGNTQIVPTPEDCPVNPLSPYGISKLAGEHYCRAYSKLHKIPTTVIRFTNAYGPFSDHGAVSVIVTRIVNNQPITLFGGDQKIQFIYVTDAANALQAAIEKKRYGVYNAGGPDVVTLKELVNIIRKISGKEVPVLFEPVKEGDIDHVEFDLSKIKRELGWHPSVAIEEGARHCVEAMMK